MILETEVVSNNNIVLFENEELGQVRVAVDENNEPLFCLSDICKILELTTPSKVADSIKREFELYELSSYSFDTGFGIKEFTMIDEPPYNDFDISDLESNPRYLKYAIDLCNDAISNNFLSRKLI
ncbi:BRO family protein [Campylobacter jejuni]|uniref:BRO family protein n=1 Tax=Campylobacter jejuni TaxID=197 RepID=UPI000F80C98E|nr:BRO family protein [Campylobacter jejuni]EAH8023766.1 hypothetical protein [Campylobacter jejuni]ELK3774971.1 hypothetical protein [Campylobacter jejuni]MDP8332851.1 BRO family protein [Campylobacter jejuni]RTJ57474.1 hypothetical protein C3H67_08515 [Campylobacter jejuni]HDZ4254792.1 hypothetical protein [Campylobacter jejuni]